MNWVLGSIKPLQGADGTFQEFLAKKVTKEACTVWAGLSDGVAPRD